MLKNYFIIWGAVFVAILLAYKKTPYMNQLVRPRLEMKEPFENKPPMEDVVEKISRVDPADATLNLPREPYSLLKGVIPLSSNRSSPTSQRCYDADFQPRIEKTGNFRQLTNNYKRAVPDSCSSPLHEFVLSFYTPPAI